MSLLDFRKPKNVDDGVVEVGGHVVKKFGGITKQDQDKRSWTIDKFVEDGQINPLPEGEGDDDI